MISKESTTKQNLRDAAKAALRGIVIKINAYVTKPGKYQINNLTLHHKELEKGEQSPELVKGRKRYRSLWK